jgi:hypothetical protein
VAETPAVPQEPEHNAENIHSNLFSQLSEGGDTGFQSQMRNVGCSKDKTQHMQLVTCICGHTLPVFNNFSWLDLNPEFPNGKILLALS